MARATKCCDLFNVNENVSGVYMLIKEINLAR